MSLKLEYAQCDKCPEIVEFNGAGSTLNLYQSMVTETINTIYPITQKLNRQASNIHDMDFHQGNYDPNLTREQWLLFVNNRFYENFLKAIENPHLVPNLNKFDRFMVRHNKWWFKHQAKKYYWALKTFSDGVAPKENCSHPSRRKPLP